MKYMRKNESKMLRIEGNMAISSWGDVVGLYKMTKENCSLGHLLKMKKIHM
jgi:hypothetical protein